MSRRPRARRPRRAARTRRFSPALAALAATLIVAVGWCLLTIAGPGPPARAGAATTVIVPAGTGLPAIARTLAEAGIIRSSDLFMFAAAASGSAHALKAGEYEIPSRASLAAILGALRRGAVVRHVVTVPEGVTSAAVLDILMRTPLLTGAPNAPPEGSILPETYETERGEDRQAVISRMRRARDALLARLWTARRANLPFRTPEEAVTLASIVERETAIPQERRRVAAVFINRLEHGMRLESDPTVIYGLTGGAPLGHGLRVSELDTPSPYNTYQLAGLPPTPIGNPGRASLEAVLNPAADDALYFVADGTGGHVFASTFEAHLKNVARWRAIEQARRAGSR